MSKLIYTVITWKYLHVRGSQSSLLFNGRKVRTVCKIVLYSYSQQHNTTLLVKLSISCSYTAGHVMHGECKSSCCYVECLTNRVRLGWHLPGDEWYQGGSMKPSLVRSQSVGNSHYSWHQNILTEWQKTDGGLLFKLGVFVKAVEAQVEIQKDANWVLHNISQLNSPLCKKFAFLLISILHWYISKHDWAPSG